MRIVAANAAAAVLVAVTFSGIGLATPWRTALPAIGIAFLFSNCIGLPIAVLMPRLGPHIWTRFRFPINWAIAIAMMMAVALAGSAVAILLLIASGAVASSAFGEWFSGSLKISLITTLTIGIAVTAYELMRARLEEATLALRTKERDEADARRLATEAQLASLESRVQPHFLFNTLNSIAALIPRDPDGAERMTEQLASLMRSSLDGSGSALVPLEQELKNILDYLAIEQVRFGERLRYKVDIDGLDQHALVPRLSLQTLVENSVKYAVSASRHGASIVVIAKRDGGGLRLSVEDDGPGFDAGSIPENHGLAMLKARLAMLFGDAAKLRIDSRPTRTAIVIEISAEVMPDR
jgi:sensor histidine kinase YesM